MMMLFKLRMRTAYVVESGHTDDDGNYENDGVNDGDD